MNVEIVSIGNELLAGMIVNSNAAFMSERLRENGWIVSRHQALPDDNEVLKQELKAALSRVDVVITTGGLGPTIDDVTRKVAAELFASGVHFNEEVAKDLKKRYGGAFISLEDQATLPSKAKVLLNSLGTAPGLVFEENGKILILLPGIPYEMQELFSAQVIPYLQQKFPGDKAYFTDRVYLCLHTESSVDPFLRRLLQNYPGLELGIYPSLGTLGISFKAQHSQTIKKAKQEFLLHYSSYAYFNDSGKIGEAVHQIFLQRKKSLAFAESCTGGAISSSLTIWPGASEYFLGSVIAYSNELKKKWLNVKETTLQEKGAVSREVIEEMLTGIFHTSSADYALAVSGIAGPSGGSAEKPVGTIWAGIAERGQPFEVGHFHLKGNRQKIISLTTNRLLSLLWRKVQHRIPAF